MLNDGSLNNTDKKTDNEVETLNRMKFNGKSKIYDCGTLEKTFQTI